MMRALALIALVNSLAAAQGYVISTFAGGAPPLTPVAAVQMAIAPQGMVADSSGNLYFISSNCVFKRDQNGVVTRVAGNSRQGYSADGGPALAAEFRFASGLAVDAAGDLFVADSGNYRVRMISPAGIVTTVAGNGSLGFSGDGGPATSAQLSGVSNVATDNQGNLFVVESARIRKVSPAGIISTVAGNGSYGFSGDGGPAINAQLDFPYAVAADTAGNLYISDDGNLRVRMVSKAGIITTVAGTGTWGMAGDGGPAINAQITGASGLALDKAGDLYFTDSSPLIADYDCYCVRKVSPAGIITTVPVGAGLFEPRALAIDSGGDLFVADTGNNQIREVAAGGAIAVAAGTGGPIGFSGDGRPAASAQFNLPSGVAVDVAGDTYIADTFNNRVRAVSPAGIVTTLVGNGVGMLSGDGGPAIDAQVYFPTAVAADSFGNVFIADHGNSRIRKVTAAGVGGVAAQISTVYSVSQVWNLAVDKNGNLYVPDPSNNRINKISPQGVITTVAGNGSFGYSGDGGPATSAEIRLLSKTALTTDSEGSLYFSDDDFQPPPPGIIPTSTSSKPRIRKVSADGNISTVAGNGMSGYSGDGGPATSAQLGSQLNYPICLATDNSGNLYIADGDNSRIRMVSRDGIITTVAGTGIQGYMGDGGPATAAQLNGPSGLASDGAGNLYVADQFNNVIRLLQPVSSNIGIAGITNAASGLTESIAPGEIVVISGSGLGPSQLVSAAPDSNGVYSVQLAGTTVDVNGSPAPLVYVWATQVAAVLPYSVTTGPAQVTVAYQGRTSASFAAPVSGSAPGLFTLDSTGKGQAVILNANGSINSPANPAKPGEVISLFATGEGETAPAGVDGQLASTSPPHPLLSVSVSIGGTTVTPNFAGGAQGEIAGVIRIDVAIPAGITGGPAVPVMVTVGASSSQQGVTIAVQ